MITETSEIVSGNKLIAEFMGYEYIPSNTPLEVGKKIGWNKDVDINVFLQKQGMIAEFPPLKLFLGRSHHDLQFHRNWSWMMPVVDKVEGLGFSITQKNDSCGIEITHYRPSYKNYIVSDVDKHDATWRIVVEFIKWYNQNYETNKNAKMEDGGDEHSV